MAGDIYLKRLGAKSEPAKVYAAYLSAVDDGDIHPLVEALLPFTINLVLTKCPDLEPAARDDVISEMGCYLLRYVPRLLEVEFTSGSAIMSYAYMRVSARIPRFAEKTLSQVIEYPLEHETPFMSASALADVAMEEAEKEEYIRSYARTHIRLSGILRRHALSVISEGRSALRGVTTPHTIRFISDYLTVMARIAGREYHGT